MCLVQSVHHHHHHHQHLNVTLSRQDIAINTTHCAIKQQLCTHSLKVLDFDLRHVREFSAKLINKDNYMNI